eukprot:4160250-Pleurochrysis_carterae.AAC.2
MPVVNPEQFYEQIRISRHPSAHASAASVAKYSPFKQLAVRTPRRELGSRAERTKVAVPRLPNQAEAEHV